MRRVVVSFSVIILLIGLLIPSLAYPLKGNPYSKGNLLTKTLRFDIRDLSFIRVYLGSYKSIELRGKYLEIFRDSGRGYGEKVCEGNAKFSISRVGLTLRCSKSVSEFGDNQRLVAVAFGPVKLCSTRGCRAYRGSIVVTRSGGSLKVLNLLYLEEYLRGVLPGEMPRNWPKEALKAQAVAARTYAVRTTIERRNSGSWFDLYSTVADQVYYGLSAEDPRTDTAIEETRGLIMVYRGEPIYAFYSADCGGRTQDGNIVFAEKLKGERYPYLKPVSCPYRGIEWRTTLSSAQILKACRSLGCKLDKIIEVQDIGDYILIHGMEGRRCATCKVYKPTFRSATGYKLRGSRYMLVGNTEGGYEFRGRGVGHGVGLCQHGARLMAERGAKFDDILRHYYPGAELKLIYKVFPKKP